jgi:hypothetical protein
MRCRDTSHPVVYEINTRVWLAELTPAAAGARATLEDVPDEELARIEALGVDHVWLMGVWRTSARSQEIARAHPGLAGEYRRALPDYTLEDVVGSPYAVAEYTVDPALGGTRGLMAFRRRLAKQGIGLLLDFVPNHTGLDHAWVKQRPEFYVQGTAAEFAADGGRFFEVDSRAGKKYLAHGKDPYFLPWTDTAQLDFSNPAAREGLTNILTTIAEECDGVRCDMAMLALSEVFQTTWGPRALTPPQREGARAAGELWGEALEVVRRRRPDFLMLAEAYWGTEPRLFSLGFDYAYDKTLYDRLVHADAAGVRAHLEGPLEHQRRCIRFLENHDEQRAAAAFPWERHQAAAVLTATSPGMLLLHEGQLEGRKVKLPVQLRRRQKEARHPAIALFYERLLEVLKSPALRHGSFRPLPVREAWQGNPTWQGFVAYEWDGGKDGLLLVTVNYGPTRGQCLVGIPHPELGGATVLCADLMSEARYLRQGSELGTKGLYLDMPPSGYHVFAVEKHAG